MIRFALSALAGLFVASAHAESVLLTAADGVEVHGDVWRAAGARAPIVVAFHQAGSSAAEYAPIAPRLVKAGFTVLAIDQRSGDGAFGGTNRTAAAFGWLIAFAPWVARIGRIYLSPRTDGKPG